VIQEGYLQSVSTRSIGDLVKAMGRRVSRTSQARCVHRIDDKIKALLNRSLERDYPRVKSGGGWTYLKTC